MLGFWDVNFEIEVSMAPKKERGKNRFLGKEEHFPKKSSRSMHMNEMRPASLIGQC